MATLFPFRGRYFFGWAGLLVGIAGRASAQTVADTTHLRYQEEVSVPAASTTPLRMQEERRSLWKLGLNNFLPYSTAFGPDSYYVRYGLHLAYEHQLANPAWSVLGELSPALTRYRPEGNSARPLRLSMRTQVAGRYYYNREKRLQQGRNVGNFSANYLAAALGTGLGQNAHETPFFLYQNHARQFVTADVALLYGLQRRLGRYGFVDANVGVAALLLAGRPLVTPVSSLRIGLTLGPQPAKYVRQLGRAGEVVTLQPRFYAGAAIGGYYYRVRYSEQNPYPAQVVKTTPTETQTTSYPVTPRDGYGSYAQYLSAGPVPYVYAGYNLTPRFALQVGFQYGETFEEQPVGTVFETPQGSFALPNQTLKERGLALPVLLRYALTPAFLKRWQFAAVGGMVPVWSTVDFREYATVNRQVTSQETFGFQRRAFGLHAALGVDASYGFGQRRRLQATTEILLNKNVRTNFQTDQRAIESGSFLAGGCTIGLRYRFGYQ